jgi:hypothetical protein
MTDCSTAGALVSCDVWSVHLSPSHHRSASDPPGSAYHPGAGPLTGRSVQRRAWVEGPKSAEIQTRTPDVLVTEQEQTVEWELEPPARIYGVQLVSGFPVAADCDLFASTLVTVFLHHAEGEILRSDYQGRPHEVSIHGIPTGTPTRLYLNQHPKFVMDGIHVVCNALDPPIAEQDGPSDALGDVLPGFHFVAER